MDVPTSLLLVGLYLVVLLLELGGMASQAALIALGLILLFFYLGNASLASNIRRLDQVIDRRNQENLEVHEAHHRKTQELGDLRRKMDYLLTLLLNLYRGGSALKGVQFKWIRHDKESIVALIVPDGGQQGHCGNDEGYPVRA